MIKLTEDLIITCRTTCGCGNKLIPYTKQTETTHYLLTCDPYSDIYNHPLLIAIDMNSPVFIKARKWDELALDEEDKDIALHGARLIKQNQKLRELIEKRRKVAHEKWSATTIREEGVNPSQREFVLDMELEKLLHEADKK